MDVARHFWVYHDDFAYFRVSDISFNMKYVFIKIEVSPLQTQAFARRKLAFDTALEYNIIINNAN